jgi:hypothetical protein
VCSASTKQPSVQPERARRKHACGVPCLAESPLGPPLEHLTPRHLLAGAIKGARSRAVIPSALAARTGGVWSQGHRSIALSLVGLLSPITCQVFLITDAGAAPPRPRRASVQDLPPASMPAAPLRKTPNHKLDCAPATGDTLPLQARRRAQAEAPTRSGSEGSRDQGGSRNLRQGCGVRGRSPCVVNLRAGSGDQSKQRTESPDLSPAPLRPRANHSRRARTESQLAPFRSSA